MTKILLVLIIFNILSLSDRLFTAYPANYWSHQFSKSQIVIGDKAPYFFSDSQLYAILGYKYLRGDLPTNLHPEVPPLGKMLIGTSIFLFKNENIASFLFSLCNLILIYLLGRFIGLPGQWSVLSLILLSLDLQFWDLATSSMLDMFLLTFLLISFLSFYKGQKNPRWFLLSSLFLGFMAGTKLYFTALLAMAVCILTMVFSGSFKMFIRHIISLPVFLLGFFLPYMTSFFSGMGIMEFIRFQRWLTSWWAGNSKIPFGGIFPIIFLNRWYTWWGSREVISVSGWNLLWPITAILAYLSPLKLIKSQNTLLLSIELWIFGYLIFMSITSPFPRYLLLLFPFWLVLALKLIHETFAKARHFLRRS